MIVPADQERLWQQYLASGHDAESRSVALRNEIAEANARLVQVLVSTKCRGWLEVQDRGDWIQEGHLALIKAIECFDPSRKVKFETYAANCIHGALLHYLRDSAGVIRSRKLSEAARQWAAARELYVNSYYTEPTPQQLANYLDCSLEAVQAAESAHLSKWTLSLDAAVFDTDLENGGISYYDTLVSETTEKMSGHQQDLAVSARAAVELLPNVLWQIVIKLRFYLDVELTQTEVGEILNYSQMHISRLERKALKWLRAILVTNSAKPKTRRSSSRVTEVTLEWRMLSEFIQAVLDKKEKLGIKGVKGTSITLNR